MHWNSKNRNFSRLEISKWNISRTTPNWEVHASSTFLGLIPPNISLSYHDVDWSWNSSRKVEVEVFTPPRPAPWPAETSIYLQNFNSNWKKWYNMFCCIFCALQNHVGAGHFKFCVFLEIWTFKVEGDHSGPGRGKGGHLHNNKLSCWRNNSQTSVTKGCRTKLELASILVPL